MLLGLGLGMFVTWAVIAIGQKQDKNQPIKCAKCGACSACGK